MSQELKVRTITFCCNVCGVKLVIRNRDERVSENLDTCGICEANTEGFTSGLRRTRRVCARPLYFSRVSKG
ncbi:hypothetical protein BLOT_013441 [Blomia tropicalis]|nr:hypothetical protein BLOT_013441 [Blomia tropicalis]